MRILLHPGFHKTGTSSVQRGAMACMELLKPHLRLMLTPDVLWATRSARKFSAQPTSLALHDFAQDFAAAVETCDPSDQRALMISAEDLSGYLPGLNGVVGYDATPALMNVATAVLRSHFGEQAEITVWYTTRTARDWQRSVYWQNLRAMRLTDSFDDHCLRLHHAARLPRVVQAVEQRLGPRAHVTSTAIETCADAPLGPLGVALGLLDVPTEGLPAQPRHNVQPDGAADELLALNRSDLADDALAEAKRQVIKRLRRAGTMGQNSTDGPS